MSGNAYRNAVALDPITPAADPAAPEYQAGPIREQWLHAAAALLASDRFLPAGYVVPRVAVSVGYPWRARGEGNNAIGQCWAKQCAADQIPHLFISPVLDETARVVDVLAHELVHATVGNQAGHGPDFKRAALAIGLTGQMTATTATDEFNAWVAARLVPLLGAYPHGRLNAPGERPRGPDGPDGTPGPADPKLGPTGAPRQGTRLLKVECPSCGCVVRMTKKWLDSVGAPACGCPDHPTMIAA
jgi:hypothetical protein